MQKISAFDKLINQLYDELVAVLNALFLLIFTFPSLCDASLIESFKQAGYEEICDPKHSEETFLSLYARFDELIDFFQTNPSWAHKLYSAKERFIRSKEKAYYSTDFCGLYDDSKKEGKNQISFYYSTHFHELIGSHYPECNKILPIFRFLEACREIQKAYGPLFDQAAADLGLHGIFSSPYGHIPILFKVVKYLPAYRGSKPHYDGSVFSLFLHSTDNQSLLLSPYKPPFTVADFVSPLRQLCQKPDPHSVLLIPGAFLTEYFIYPTPHIVIQSSQTRYAAIAFAMRPNLVSQPIDYAPLPNFKD